MKHFIIFIGMLFINTSYSSNRVSDGIIELNKNTKDVVNDYIIKNHKFNAFILKPTNGFENNKNVINANGLLLGPAYSEILDIFPSSLYFDISGKRVFYLTEINNFLIESSNWNINTKNDSDSIIYNGQVINNPWLLFICQAIYIYKNENLIEVNFRPDTIFVPKLLETTIHFENKINY